jgi:2-polyprenyl-3-methyl-5-hydroxy-6-metoxy-1,4-benzoquinol methylase
MINKHPNVMDVDKKFEFGVNWSKFLSVLDEERIEEAEKSLKTMLDVDAVVGKTFLDIGSGSGLFSLAAKRMGGKVCSFDYDKQSVVCTEELKDRYFNNDPDWIVQEGSVLDREYLQSLGQFDIVYSWGVLHHTGAMWDALENVIPLIAQGGTLYIAIYNDQGKKSGYWKIIKKTYNILPRFLKLPFALFIMVPREVLFVFYTLLTLQPMYYIRSWTHYKSSRGMSRWHDLIDWVGGYPFEVAKPEEIFDFYHKKGFQLEKLKTCAGRIGPNEFIFRRN